MRRLAGWEPSLISYLRSIVNEPFQWGKHDCFIFSGTCIKLITGDAYIDDAIGKYDSFESSQEFSRSHGFKNHIHFVARRFKPRPSLLQAMRGDLVIMPGLQNEPALGICQGSRVYSVGESGLYTVCMSHAKRVFET